MLLLKTSTHIISIFKITLNSENYITHNSAKKCPPIREYQNLSYVYLFIFLQREMYF